MVNRTQQAIEVLSAGGFFRKALETQYRGGEKFAYRLHDATGAIIKGVGFVTFTELESQLMTRDCARSSVWPTEWVLRKAGAPIVEQPLPLLGKTGDGHEIRVLPDGTLASA